MADRGIRTGEKPQRRRPYRIFGRELGIESFLIVLLALAVPLALGAVVGALLRRWGTATRVAGR
jgi:hypothetical protein